MACSTSTLSTPPACSLKFTSDTQQLKDLNFLLAAAINKIDNAVTINWTTFKTEAKAVAACVPTGVAKSTAAQRTEAGLSIASLTAQNCYTTSELYQVMLYLTCVLISKINP